VWGRFIPELDAEFKKNVEAGLAFDWDSHYHAEMARAKEEEEKRAKEEEKKHEEEEEDDDDEDLPPVTDGRTSEAIREVLGAEAKEDSA
jgi:hypothetical protein